MRWGRRKPSPRCITELMSVGTAGAPCREEGRLQRDAGREFDPLAPWEGRPGCANVQAPRFAPVYAFLVVAWGRQGRSVYACRLLTAAVGLEWKGEPREGEAHLSTPMS